MNEMETELITAALGGDQRAYTAITRQYEGRLYQAAYAFLHDIEEAADVVQETFFRAYRNLSKFEVGRPLYPWLYRITRNLCINRAKSTARRRHGTLEVEPADLRHLPEDELLKVEEGRRVHRCVENLPDQAREIILLKHFQECSYAEMADILDIPIGTVMSRLYNARKLLKKELEKEN